LIYYLRFGTEQVKDHIADPSTGISAGTVLTVSVALYLAVTLSISPSLHPIH